MRKHRFLRFLAFIPLVLALVAMFAFFVMRLWNWLTPALFGWHVITFWQALGVLVLSKILFGGFRGGPRRDGSWRRRMFERWEQMTPEEREKLRSNLRGGCGPFPAQTPEAKA